MKLKYFSTSVFFIAFFAGWISTGAEAKPSEKQKVRTIRWVIAHNLNNLPFTKLIENFSRKLTEKSGGQLKVELVHLQAPDNELDDIAYKQILNGEADMSQIGAGSLFPRLSSELNVLDMPFVFRNYEHAQAFFDSLVGKRLIADIRDESDGKIRGFAFTYSGGLRVLAGKVKIERTSDFKNVRMSGHDGGPFLAAFLRELGVSVSGAKSRRNDISNDLKSGKIDLTETEVNRLADVIRDHSELANEKYRKFVNVTHHRMYITAILANEKFFSGLTEEQRRLFTEEVVELAGAERKLSVGLEKQSREYLTQTGVQFVELSDPVREALFKAGEAVHQKFPTLGQLIQEIRAIKETAVQVAEKPRQEK